MKTKKITLYLTSIVMFTLSGLLVLDNSFSQKETEIKYFDFSESPLYIYSKESQAKNK